jgi:hypothetical protein
VRRVLTRVGISDEYLKHSRWIDLRKEAVEMPICQFELGRLVPPRLVNSRLCGIEQWEAGDTQIT